MDNKITRIFLSSLTRRIFLINFIGLSVMLSSMLFLNSLRDSLIEERVESLKIQCEIIAGAIAETSQDIIIFPTIDPEKFLELQVKQDPIVLSNDEDNLNFPINPIRIAPILRDLVSPTRTQAKIFDVQGHLIVDSKHLYSETEIEKKENNFIENIMTIIQNILPQTNLPIYDETNDGNGLMYEEVVNAVDGNIKHAIRKKKNGETVVSVAVPVRKQQNILGVLQLTTQAGDIDRIIRNDRWAIISVFIIASIITLILAMILASTIAIPLRKLSDAAERVKIRIKRREKIPDFSNRYDEIGHLSETLQEMTQSLYTRIEHIESFAADVSHEIKNPLTSLQSAVETLPKTKNEEQKKQLMEIIKHDVLRLDRLITDISDASRLDAELARQEPEPVNMAELLQQFQISHEKRNKEKGYVPIHLHIAKPKKQNAGGNYTVGGHKDRLGQVLANIVDNAKSFVDKENGKIDIFLSQNTRSTVIEICDNGKGIESENLEKIFERFYTDRPEEEKFGNNSGLGLSITRQIIEAHGGRIVAKNNKDINNAKGTCFRICLPLCKRKK